MYSNYIENTSAIFQMKERNIFQKYIDFIHFPFYRNMEVNSRINFIFPLTVIVGQNGCGKSSLLHAVYGMPQKYTPYKFWFDTKVDPIEYYNDEKKRHSFWYQYTENNRIHQVVKARIKRGNDPNYWETSRPLSWAGMNVQERYPPIEKNVIYLDFREELSAFDKYFYFGNLSNTKAKNKQEYIRRKSSFLHKALSDKDYIAKSPYGRELNKPVERLAPNELEAISYILGRSYTDALSIFHSFFRNEGYSILFKTQYAKYSEAFAGSGEMAIVRLVQEIIKAPDYSLIILDEPEVSLHPGAQERLTFFLLEQIKIKKHQIIVTSHSPSIIKHLPKEAIKVLYQNPNTGRFFVKENLLPTEAFFHLEFFYENKKRIHFEDVLAKEIIGAVLKNLGKEKEELFNLSYNPGGCTIINKDFIPIYCREEESQEFIIFDGDQCFSQHIDWRNIPNNDLTLLNLKELVFNQTKCHIEFHVDGNKGKGNSNQKIDLYKKYLDFYNRNVFYLPCNIPEDIIWNSNVADKLLSTIYDNQEYQSAVDKIERIENTKMKFEQLALFIYQKENTNSEVILNLEKLFIQSWIKRNNEHYNQIVETINTIASL